MTPVEMHVPDGYRIEETKEIINDDDKLVVMHWLKMAAIQHCQRLNDERFMPTYRYEVEKLDRATRKRAGWSFWHRWAVVPYQNRLVKI